MREVTIKSYIFDFNLPVGESGPLQSLSQHQPPSCFPVNRPSLQTYGSAVSSRQDGTARTAACIEQGNDAPTCLASLFLD